MNWFVSHWSHSFPVVITSESHVLSLNNYKIFKQFVNLCLTFASLTVSSLQNVERKNELCVKDNRFQCSWINSYDDEFLERAANSLRVKSIWYFYSLSNKKSSQRAFIFSPSSSSLTADTGELLCVGHQAARSSAFRSRAYRCWLLLEKSTCGCFMWC